MRVGLASGDELVADAFVLATGVELPPRLAEYLDGWRGDPEWCRSVGAGRPGCRRGRGKGRSHRLEPDGDRCHGHDPEFAPARRVVALSRHGKLPRAHEDPWRPRFTEPVFTFEEFFAFERPFERQSNGFARWHGLAARDRFAAADQPALWDRHGQSMRQEFLANYRNAWDTHRHRDRARA